MATASAAAARVTDARKPRKLTGPAGPRE
jgi:hypothetical protein